MKKYKVLCISPYEGMKGLAEMVGEGQGDIDLTVQVGNLEQAIDLLTVLPEAENYDAIISRGGTAELIKAVTRVPVVEIPISAFDMLRAIQLTEDYHGKSAIVGFSSITGMASMLCQLLQQKTDIFTISSQQSLIRQLRELKEQGYTVVMGDTVTTNLASENGIHAILITSGIESIRSAIAQTIKLCDTYIEERRLCRLALRAFAEMKNHAVVCSSDKKVLLSSFGTEETESIKAIIAHKDTAKKDGKFICEHHGEKYMVNKKTMHCLDGQFSIFQFSQLLYSLNAINPGVTLCNAEDLPKSSFDFFYDQNPVMKNLQHAARQYADTLLPLIIYGEIGTGKLSMAHSMQNHSSLCRNPMLKIECSQLSRAQWRHLLEHPESPFSEAGITVLFNGAETIDAA